MTFTVLPAILPREERTSLTGSEEKVIIAIRIVHEAVHSLHDGRTRTGEPTPGPGPRWRTGGRPGAGGRREAGGKA